MWTGDDAKPAPQDILTPDTPGRDVDSDELSFAKWRRSPSVERKKKKKSNLKHAITPEQMLYARQARSDKTPFQEDPASSGMESPSAAFAETVNKSTGYSPINPTVSLHTAFQDLAPPPPERSSRPPFDISALFAKQSPRIQDKTQATTKSHVAPPSPVQPHDSTSSSEGAAFDKWTSRMKDRKSRTASPVIPAASPTDETRNIPAFLPLTATPPPTAETWMFPAPPPEAETPISPTSARRPLESVRRALFRRAFLDSIKGVKFDDTHIYVYSARTRAGVAHRPLAVHARSDFLQAASSVFSDEVYDRCVVDPKSVLGRRADRTDYGYDHDSDLEDEEDDMNACVNATEAVLTKSTVPAAPPAQASCCSREATPKSSTLSMTDLEVMSSDDLLSEHSISEVIEETSRTMVGSATTDNTVTPLRTPSKPPLSLSTNDAVLHWRAAQDMTAVPVERALEAAPPLVTKDTSSADTKADISTSVVDSGERTLFIPDSAHKTWQALLLFLYNEDLEFAPLRSQRRSAANVSNAPAACSPKSMYRLAAKLGLDALKEKSFAALTQALSRENIVDELFSDFTWRYPEVLRMETDVFHRYSSDTGVQAAMAEKFQDIAYGHLPHSSAVLNSLFMRFIGGPSSTGTPRLR